MEDFIGCIPLAIYVAFRIIRFIFRFIEAFRIWTDEKIESQEINNLTKNS